MTTTFLTGGTGFLGARVIAALGDAGRVRALSRAPRPASPGLEWIQGDVGSAAAYRDALRGTDVVVHAAAATGRVRAADHQRVNVDGTHALLAAARDAGVRRFVFVSSIAVKFADLSRYPYGRAKAAAERAVRESGLDWTIVRPTIITGPCAPVLAGLRRLAGLPVVPVFGPGRARVQPIWVDDVAALVARLATSGGAARTVVEAGGPDVVTIEGLLLAIRKHLGRSRGRVVHLPLGPLQAALATVERVADGHLPLTAGQLCTFQFDGVADAHPLWASLPDRLPLADQLLRSLAA